MSAISCVFAQFIFVALICRGSSDHQQSCPDEEGETWSYNTLYTNGPREWGEYYHSCNGKMQSPIDIKLRQVKRDKDLEPLHLVNYHIPVTKALLKNNGHTIIVIPDDEVPRSMVVNSMHYNLIQFNFHWGSKLGQGSEHTVNGKQYPMELQLVHADKEGRRAVIAVLLQQVYFKNPGLTPIVDLLSVVLFKGDEVYMQRDIDLLKLVDEKCSFYRYMGSLTFPPCQEGVIWSVCKRIKFVGYSQLKAFRELFSVSMEAGGDIHRCKLSDNFRRPQPLNRRRITSSK